VDTTTGQVDCTSCGKTLEAGVYVLPVEKKSVEPELLRFDGFNAAIIGVVQQFNKRMVCYDRDKILDILMADGTDHESAEEWLEYNMQGAWVGEGTPAILTKKADTWEMSDLSDF